MMDKSNRALLMMRYIYFIGVVCGRGILVTANTTATAASIHSPHRENHTVLKLSRLSNIEPSFDGIRTNKKPISSIMIQSTASFPSSSTFQTTNLPRRITYNKEACYASATHDAYQSDMCGAPNSTAYVIRSRALLSCEGRCGEKAAYSVSGDLECSCDALCLAMGDCCQDFAESCSEIKARAEKRYQQFSRQCNYVEKTQVITSCHSDSNAPRLETPRKGASLYMPDGYRKPLIPDSTLPSIPTIFGDSIMNNVVDVTHGVIFSSIDVFNDCKLSDSVVSLIPKIVVLKCPWSNSDQVKNFAEALLNCSTTPSVNLPTNFHRPCQRVSTIFCYCPNGVSLHDSLHDVCLGSSKVSAARHVGINIEDYIPRHSRFDTAVVVNVKCNYLTAREQSPWIISKDYLKGLSAEITAQLLTANTANELEEFPDMAYEVRLRNMLERRLRCPDVVGSFSQCKIRACARSALLMVSKPSSPAIGGQVCKIPSYATAKVSTGTSGVSMDPLPMCTCTRILAALSRLSIWRVLRVHVPSGHCLLKIVTIQSDEVDTPTSFSFEEKRPTTQDDINLSPKLFGEHLLKKLNETRNFCSPDELAIIIQLCFVSSKHLNPEEEDSDTLPLCTMLNAGEEYIPRSAFARILTVLLSL